MKIVQAATILVEQVVIKLQNIIGAQTTLFAPIQVFALTTLLLLQKIGETSLILSNIVI